MLSEQFTVEFHRVRNDKGKPVGWMATVGGHEATAHKPGRALKVALRMYKSSIRQAQREARRQEAERARAQNGHGHGHNRDHDHRSPAITLS